MLQFLTQVLFSFTCKQQLDVNLLGKKLGINKLEDQIKEKTTELTCEDLEIWIEWLNQNLHLKNAALQIACCSNLGQMGAIGSLIQTCRNLKESARVTTQWMNANNSFFKMEVTEEKELVTIKYLPDNYYMQQYPTLMQVMMQTYLTATYSNYNKLLIEDYIPLAQVSFACKAPVNIACYEKTFRIRPVFNTRSYSLSFSKKWLNCPIISHNKELFDLLENHIFTKPKQKEMRLSQFIKEDIKAAFRTLNNITVEDVADLHSLSTRSIQRTLKKENTSFRQLQELAKRELSLALLPKQEMSIKEVTYLLGYSSISAFSKAFKRWEGMAPSEFQSQYKF